MAMGEFSRVLLDMGYLRMKGKSGKYQSSCSQFYCVTLEAVDGAEIGYSNFE